MTEFDMGAVREMFTKVLDTVAEATQLSRDVAELRETVNTFRKEIEDARATNRWLDGQIVELRTQRDARAQEAAELATSLVTAQADLRTANNSVEGLTNDFTRLSTHLADVRKERDDALMQNMQLEEENGKLKARLAQIEAIFKPEATPVAEPHPLQQIEEQPNRVVSGSW